MTSSGNEEWQVAANIIQQILAQVEKEDSKLEHLLEKSDELIEETKKLTKTLSQK